MAELSKNVNSKRYIWTRSKYYLDHKASYIHSLGLVVIAFPFQREANNWKWAEKVSYSSIFTILSIINWMNDYDFRINRICFLEARILNKDVEKWGNLKIRLLFFLVNEIHDFSRIVFLQMIIFWKYFSEFAYCGGEEPISNELGFSSQRQRQNNKQGAKKLQISPNSVLDNILYLALRIRVRIFTSCWHIWNNNMFLC